MQHSYRRLFIALGAENCSGKSSVAAKLTEGHGFHHYSVRSFIQKRFRKEYGKDPDELRDIYTTFSISQKQKYGAHTFIQDIVDDFLDSHHRICVCESIRSIGEVQWLHNLNTHLGQPVWYAFVMLTADKDQRRERFKKRPDSLALELTDEEFERQEVLSNSGLESWSENIGSLKRYAHLTVKNNDGMLDEAVQQFLAYAEKILGPPKKKSTVITY